MNFYSRLKSQILRYFPKKTLLKYEFQIRSLLAVWYLGKSFQCNICRQKLRTFIKHGEDLICPRCGSLGRTRRLRQLLHDEFLDPHKFILHFSPPRFLYQRMKKQYPKYLGSDFLDEFVADESFNIENIDAPDSSFDLIICYHVLEHVEQDQIAMSELKRVLTPGGTCLIQTPFKKGSVYEDPNITSRKDRKIHFGQEDHLRIYSIEGLKSRLESVGFVVEIRHFQEEPNNYNGFKTDEFVLICQ